MKHLLIALLLVSYGIAQESMIAVDTLRFTRSAVTTAYTAGDVVRSSTQATAGGPFFVLNSGKAFVGMSRGKILSVLLQVDTASATNGTFSVKFYSDSTGLGKELPADNAAFAPTLGWMKHYIGAVACTLAVSGSVAVAETHGLSIPYRLTNSSQNLYAVIVATGAYPGVSSKVFRLVVVSQKEN